MNDHITLSRQLHEAMPELDAEYRFYKLHRKDGREYTVRRSYKTPDLYAPDFTSDDLLPLILRATTSLEIIFQHKTGEILIAYLDPVKLDTNEILASTPADACIKLGLELHKQGLLK